MKHSSLLILASASALGIATINTSCIKADAAAGAGHEATPESGAQFKEGQGISLTAIMAESIGLQTAEVLEEQVTPSVTRVMVPRTALLTTVEGHFVYAENGGFFLRTPVKIGTQRAERVEIADGLYAGDEIVSAAVMSLWLTELQYLRGGKACACATD